MSFLYRIIEYGANNLYNPDSYSLFFTSKLTVERSTTQEIPVKQQQAAASTKMQFKCLKLTPFTLTIIFALTLLCFLEVAQASYKKPPFNGSIFGKRANGITDYDNAGRALASLCEIANESCSAWFPESTK